MLLFSAQYLTNSFMGIYKTSKNELAFTVGEAQVINIVGCLFRFAISKPLGKFSDKTSYATGFLVGAGMLSACFFLNMFTSPSSRWMVYFYTLLYHGSSAVNTHSNGTIKAELNIQDPRSIYYGMTGERVRSLQLALRRAGYYNAAIDSVFGDNTLAAVRKFQGQHGLKADGIAGVKTQAKLNMINQGHAPVGYSFVLGMGSKCPEVRSLQSWLSRKGYGPCTDANGFFGTSTRDLLLRWQRDHGRTPTGTMTEAEYNQTVAAP
jgi:peptidoglycan hydrolase-like protein with peptidoglycan-binding domain